MARVFARTYSTGATVVALIAVSFPEVESWLHQGAWRVRGLHCPQCHASCRQLYLVPYRSLLFMCWKCAQLHKKHKLRGSVRPEGTISSPAMDALVKEHGRTVRLPENENEPTSENSSNATVLKSLDHNLKEGLQK